VIRFVSLHAHLCAQNTKDNNISTGINKLSTADDIVSKER
jgi:hypothetical protein